MHETLPRPLSAHQPATPIAPRNASHPLGWVLLGVAVLLASCATTPPPEEPAPVALPAPEPEPVPVPEPVVVPMPRLISEALNAKDYRQDGARHIYKLNSNRIYHGQLPPLMHAIGVLQVDIDSLGQVRRLNWMRAPTHAPDVIQEIERTVQAAAPFPAPVHLGGVTYTGRTAPGTSTSSTATASTTGSSRRSCTPLACCRWTSTAWVRCAA